MILRPYLQCESPYFPQFVVRSVGFPLANCNEGISLLFCDLHARFKWGHSGHIIIRRRGGSWATWQGPHQESVSANERPAAVSVLGCGGRRSSWPILLPDQLALPYFNDSSTYIIKLWLDTRLFELGPLNITYAR